MLNKHCWINFEPINSVHYALFQNPESASSLIERSFKNNIGSVSLYKLTYFSKMASAQWYQCNKKEIVLKFNVTYK